MKEEKRKSTLSDINRNWARRIVEELLEAGITTLCYSPGFRSSPLIWEAQENKKMEIIPVVDERSNAFFSLGIGKSNKNPTALLCTSGTACANFHPAILEAYYGHTPLFIITADRPSNLIGLGANQTMDQRNLYGKHVHSFINLEAPRKEIDKKDLSHLSYTMQKLNYTARSKQGPVHLNIEFEEHKDDERLTESLYKQDRIHFLSENNKEPNLKAVQDVSALIEERKENSIILLGASSYSDDFFKNIASIAEKLNIPIVADAASGVAFKIKEKHLILNSDLYLSDIRNLTKIKTFIRFGPPMIDKRWSDPDFFSDRELILFDEEGEARNPARGNATYISGAMENWACELSKTIPTMNKENPILNELKERELQNSSKIRKLLEEEKELTEWHVARFLNEHLPEKSKLFIGNSMPIRDFNNVARAKEREVKVFSNRGLSGIDGLIATAAGIAYSTKKSTFALIGDLSASHDVGSLAIPSTLDIENFTLIVLNNGGGEIFRKLTPDTYSKDCLVTPQKISFQSIASAYGFQYKKIETKNDLEKLISLENKIKTLIEVFVNKEANTKIRSLV